MNEIMNEWEYVVYTFAEKLHKGQLDDSGKDYFSAHVLHVVNILKATIPKSNPEYTTIITSAYLHDILEDTPITEAELRRSYGNVITDIVMELTHEGNKTTGYYFPRLKSKNAIIIKFADRLSNLSRMDVWVDKRQQQYINKSKFWEIE